VKFIITWRSNYCDSFIPNSKDNLSAFHPAASLPRSANRSCIRNTYFKSRFPTAFDAIRASSNRKLSSKKRKSVLHESLHDQVFKPTLL
jgi:hypothetical protein